MCLREDAPDPSDHHQAGDGRRGGTGEQSPGQECETQDRGLFLAGIVLVVGLAFLAYGSQINYRINETEANIAKIQNEIENLNVEIAANSSPEIIEKKAMEELGMEYPNASQYVYLDRTSKSDVQTAKKDD